MHEVLSQLSNREIALLIWLVIFLVALVAYRPARESLRPLLELIFFSKITVSLIAMLVYVALVIVAFAKVGLWHLWMVKDTLFWLFGTAIILLGNTTKTAEEEHYFKKLALDNLKFAVVLDFVLNLYVFNLFVELLLLPVLAFLAMLAVVAGTKDEYAPVKKLISAVTALIGFGFLLYAVVSMTHNFHDFATLKNLEDFLVPIVLTLTFLPFVYGMALFSVYELLFVRLDLPLRNNQELAAYTKRQVFKVCGLRLRKVNRFANEFANKVGMLSTEADVRDVMNEFGATSAVQR